MPLLSCAMETAAMREEECRSWLLQGRSRISLLEGQLKNAIYRHDCQTELLQHMRELLSKAVCPEEAVVAVLTFLEEAKFPQDGYELFVCNIMWQRRWCEEEDNGVKESWHWRVPGIQCSHGALATNDCFAPSGQKRTHDMMVPETQIDATVSETMAWSRAASSNESRISS